MNEIIVIFDKITDIIGIICLIWFAIIVFNFLAEQKAEIEKYFNDPKPTKIEQGKLV
jgi:hypothetical protein